MFVFTFNTFIGGLICNEPPDGIPSDSPVLIFFIQEGDLTKHEMLRRFNHLLSSGKVRWLRPLRQLTDEWIIDLRVFRESYKVLQASSYLRGTLTIEPEYYQEADYDEDAETPVSIKSIIRFSIYPADIQSYSSDISIIPKDLTDSLEKFSQAIADPRKCGFLMMKFEDSPLQKNIVATLKKLFEDRGLRLLRADEFWFSDDLLTNIKTYLHGCGFGVAIFERINSSYFNPNVSLEIGYMMALRKPIVYLKDRTLHSLHSDLVGKLYLEFDYQNLDVSLKAAVDKWFSSNHFVF